MGYQQDMEYMEYMEETEDNEGIDTSALSTYSRGRNFNNADGSGLPTTDATHYGSSNNSTFHSTTRSSAHNSMTYSNQDYYHYPGIGQRVSSPEQMDHAYPAPTSTRSNRKQPHDEAHRTRYEKRTRKKKNNSTDTILSMAVHQGSDDETDSPDRRPRRSKDKKTKYKSEGNDDPLGDTGEAPWTSMLVEDRKKHNLRLKHDVDNPNLPR